MTETEVLARTIYGEARSGDVEDATAIACVILNRVGYRNWPNNVADVCLQPMQFSVWNETDAGRARMLRAERGKTAWFDQCWQIAEQALRGALVDKTRTSTHYHTRAVAPRWSRGKTPCYETQGHLYFNNIDTKAPSTPADTLAAERPLASTRTVVGSVVAGAGVAAAMVEPLIRPDEVAAVTAVASALGWSGLAGLLPHLVTLAGLAYAVYARIDDRRKGLR